MSLRDAAENDCRDVVVDVDEHGADVTFTTRDERTATRRISRPSDLGPLIEALLVTVPEAPSRPTVAAAAADETASEPAGDWSALDTPPTEATPAERPATNRADRGGLVVALGAGMTVGAGDAGALGQLELGYVTRGWELGVVGRLEPAHEAPKTTAHASLTAIGASVLAAHRAALGSSTLIFGGTLGVFDISEEARRDATPTGDQRHEDDLADVRVGAMLGWLAPRIGPIRLRGQVDAQLGLLEETPKYADLPSNPRFTLAFTLGAETNLLP